MAKKYKIIEPEPMIVNEPIAAYETSTSNEIMEDEEDLARAISMEEFAAGAKEHLRKLYREGKK